MYGQSKSGVQKSVCFGCECIFQLHSLSHRNKEQSMELTLQFLFTRAADLKSQFMWEKLGANVLMKHYLHH